MTQLDLLTTPAHRPLPMARRTDPETSHKAAESMRDVVQHHHAKILRELREIGPLGKDALARLAGMSGVAVARRLPELERQGLAIPTGRTVKSNTGRQEREWRAV